MLFILANFPNWASTRKPENRGYGDGNPAVNPWNVTFESVRMLKRGNEMTALMDTNEGGDANKVFVKE